MSRTLPRLLGLVTTLIAVATLTPSAMADMQGIDVSGWQPATITRQVNADFAIIKITQGTGFVNSSWTTQARGATDTGKRLGLYHYAGGNDPIREADHFLTHAQPYVRRAMLVLDWEANQNRAWGNGNWVRRFTHRIHERTGVWPMVYVQASAIHQIPADVRRQCGLWVAQYASTAATGWQQHPWKLGAYGEAMRQYTSNGRLNGYTGPLDLNIFRGEPWQWDRYANPTSQPTPQPAPTPAPAPARPAQGRTVTVRSGDTVSGIAARTGLWPVTAWRVPSGNINRIWPGQTITYTGQTTTTSSTRIHVVKTGQTLSGIFGATGWQRVARLNNLANPNLIYPGQRLRY